MRTDSRLAVSEKQRMSKEIRECEAIFHLIKGRSDEALETLKGDSTLWAVIGDWAESELSDFLFQRDSAGVDRDGKRRQLQLL